MKSTEYSFDDLIKIMALLRSPSGCPWDREQTHDSLKRYLIEEAYEVVDALEKGDITHLKEELGDLLLQVIFHSQIASEAGKFNIDDIVSDLVVKLKRRHPHVFSDVEVSSVDEVMIHWERIKGEEKARLPEPEAARPPTSEAIDTGGQERSLLAGVPKSLPSLLYGFIVQGKARLLGFDWDKAEDVFEKLSEEMVEFKEACLTGGDVENEIGDLLFTIVNIARHFDIDPEMAMRRTINKFCLRFEQMEKIAEEQGQNLAEMSLEEKDKLWEEAKESEK